MDEEQRPEKPSNVVSMVPRLPNRDLEEETFDIRDEPSIYDLGDPDPDSHLQKQGLSVCRDCIYQHDPRPWYKRWFSKPRAMEPVCLQALKREIHNPVTGKPSFIEHNNVLFSLADEQAFRPCYIMNPQGTCIKFKPC